MSETSSRDSFTTVGPADIGTSVAQNVGSNLRGVLQSRLSAPLVVSLADLHSNDPNITCNDSVSVAGRQQRELSSLSADEVFVLLHALELGRYADQFFSLPIRGVDLESATDADLCEAGMTIGVHRRALQNQVSSFAAHGVPEAYLDPTCVAAAPADAPGTAEANAGDAVAAAVSAAAATARAEVEATRLIERAHEANTKGDAARARSLFQQAAALQQGNKLGTRISAANMALKLGDTSGALSEYEQLLQRPELSEKNRQLCHRKVDEAVRMPRAVWRRADTA